MIAIVNGVEGGTIDLFKGSNAVVLATLLDDTGVQLDLTSGTLQLLVYTYEDRREAFTDDAAGAIVDASAGAASFTFVPADLSYGPQTNNAPYWGYVKFTESGGAEHVARTPVKINIK